MRNLITKSACFWGDQVREDECTVRDTRGNCIHNVRLKTSWEGVKMKPRWRKNNIKMEQINVVKDMYRINRVESKVFSRMNAVLSKGPNRLGVSFPLSEDGYRSSFRNVVFSSI
jgi:hypothetical protein